MLKTNDVGETVPEGMSAAGDHAGAVWSEKDGVAAVALVRARDAQWRAEIDAAIEAERVRISENTPQIVENLIRDAVKRDREARDERWRDVIRGLLVMRREHERADPMLGAFSTAINAEGGEPANGTPLRAAVDAIRARGRATPQPVTDPGVSEYESAWRELGCRVPVEQSLAAAPTKTCRCVYGMSVPTPFDRCNHCGLPLA